MSFECFQSKRANLAASNLPSPTEVAYLPTNGIVARIVSTNQLPRDVFGKGDETTHMNNNKYYL